MIKNIGSTDKIVRFALAAILIIINFTLPLSGILSYLALAVSAIAIATALLNFCPLWTVFGINTNKK